MQDLWHSWGPIRPPEKITQEPFDSDDGHLRRLVRLRPRERAEAGDLWAYTQDLLYAEAQVPLLVYAFPFCMEAWRQELRNSDTQLGGFVENFYPVLANPKIYQSILGPKRTAAVFDFMRQAILEEIDDQSGLSFKGPRARPYKWFRTLTSYGVLSADIDQLWNQWWRLNSVGRGVATVQYISCLMYGENENPVFSPWTPDGGGGPPPLWGFEGHLYQHRWLQPNVDFLGSFLSAEKVRDVLSRAVEALAGQQEHAAAVSIQKDFPLCVDTVESRCKELPRMLETVQTGLPGWSR